MHFPASTLFLSLAASVIAAPLAAPQEGASASAAASSKKNVYLSTCSTRALIFEGDAYNVAIYYNGPSSSKSPSDIATVSDTKKSWEGQSRRIVLGPGYFQSTITPGADSLEKSQIAGTAKLGNEDFICFRDGTSTFQFSEGLLGLRSTTCRAEYWCASTAVDN